MRCILAIDVGTSSTKTALWDEHGHMRADASYAYELQRPDSLSAEINAEVWWEAVCITIQQVMTTADVTPDQIIGIGIDGIGWTLVPVDRHVRPLCPALIWLDRRAQKETEWLQGLSKNHDLVKLVANPIDSAYITPKLLWLKNQHPEVFDNTHKFLTCSGYLVAKLTGEFSCDFTQAYGYHFFDIAHECWDSAAAEAISIPLDKMPQLSQCTDIVGKVTAEAAEQTGLSAGIPVIAGCLDAAAGALGAGVTRPGQTNEQGGQAGGMAVSLDHIVVEPRLIFSHHVLTGQYLLQAGTVGGGALSWFRDILGQVEGSLPGHDAFDLFNYQARTAPAGAHGLLFIPYMAGERTPLWNSNARGVFFGLSYNTTRADMLRAIMEGCAFAVYDNIQIAAQSGVASSEFLGSGGATRSAAWCQIKADVYNKPFVVARREDGGEGGHLLGLYALTAFAVGLCNDIGSYVNYLLPERQVFEPSGDNHALYEDIFGVYLSVSRKSLDDSERLAAISHNNDR